MFRSVALLACAAVVSAVKEHDNWIYFDSNVTLAVTFDEANHSITHGQPYSGAKGSGHGVLVKAGRHKSSEVAAAFVFDVTAANVIATRHFIDEFPKELNFAVFGNLTLTDPNNNASVTCNNFRMAQGHYETHNNWWLGASYCISVPTTGVMKCSCGLKKVEFHTESKDSDHIYVLFRDD